MFLRSLLVVAVAATPLLAQAPAGQARPPMGERDRMADPIPFETVPAYIRRTAPTDPVILRMWEEGMNRSQAMTLAQQFLDPLGQRMTGSPESDASQDWLVRTYQSWGVTARKERYGTWTGWGSRSCTPARSSFSMSRIESSR